MCEISPRSSAPRASAARSGWRAPPRSAPSSWCLGVVGGDARAGRRRRGGKNPRADSHKGEGGEGRSALPHYLFKVGSQKTPPFVCNLHISLLHVCHYKIY